VSYSSDIAKLLAGQLAKFVTLNRHQLAGHAANLDFWLAEIRHCLEVIDGYSPRFERLREAQQRYVSAHNTTEFNLDDPCCTQRPAARPKRLPDAELREARLSLCNAAYRFLVRCCNEGFIAESELREACSGLGIGIEASDLKPRA
jgi:hypothetical protein